MAHNLTASRFLPSPILGAGKGNVGDVDGGNVGQVLDTDNLTLRIGREEKGATEDAAFLRFDLSGPTEQGPPVPAVQGGIKFAWLQISSKQDPVFPPGKFRLGFLRRDADLAPGGHGQIIWPTLGFPEDANPALGYDNQATLPHPTTGGGDLIISGVITLDLFTATIDYDATNFAQFEPFRIGTNQPGGDFDPTHVVPGVPDGIELFRQDFVQPAGPGVQNPWPAIGFVLDPFETADVEHRAFVFSQDDPSSLFHPNLIVVWEGRGGVIETGGECVEGDELALEDRVGADLALEDRVEARATLEPRVAADVDVEDRIDAELEASDRIAADLEVEPCS